MRWEIAMFGSGFAERMPGRDKGNTFGGNRLDRSIDDRPYGKRPTNAALGAKN